MPEHTSWFTYLMSLTPFERLQHMLNGQLFTYPMLEDPHTHRTYPMPVTLEFVSLAIFVIFLIMIAVFMTRARISRTEKAIVPEGRLSITSFVEVFVETFYGMVRDAVGPKDARIFFPIIGTCAVFIFTSNALGLIPGFAPPTSNFNVTLACGLVIFSCTHFFGFQRNGIGYLKHFMGPKWWLAPLIFPLEIISHLVRPLSLGIRLMVNMFVDHLLVSVFTALVALFVPVPIMLMGVLVIMVQTYVFCLLSTVYIQMAISHDEGEHAEEHAHGHAHEAAHDDHAEPAHADGAQAA